MKKLIITTIVFLFTGIGLLQAQGINYKAIVKDGSGNPITNDLIQVQFNILEGVAQTNVYSETHTPTTDANGVIIVNIGEGTLVSGSAAFSTVDWSEDVHFLQVLINTGSGLVDMGITKFKTVPYAIASGDKIWKKNTDLVYLEDENVGIGTATPTERLEINDIDNAGISLVVPQLGDTSKLEFKNGDENGTHSFYRIENVSDFLRFQLDTDLSFANGYEQKMSLSNSGLSLETGTSINEFSTDGTLTGNSNNAVPTEAAVKTYVDNAVGDKVIFKVRGNGFAVKPLAGGTTVETDIWDIEVYDTANAFNTTTDRFVVPESGYYYLHAVVRQSNTVTSAFFRIHFNVDTGINYTQIVDGDDVKINVSGIYYLNAGQEVFVNLRNFSTGNNVNIDGTGSWFEGYKL